MLSVVYALDNEVHQKMFEDRDEANSAFKALNNKKLPIWASGDQISSIYNDRWLKKYNMPCDFKDAEVPDELYENKNFDEALSEGAATVGIVKGCDFEYSESLGIWIAYFYGKGGCQESSIVLIGKTTYAEL